MKLINRKTGEPEDVPEEQVQVGVLNGSHDFPQGVRVPVISPDGRPGTILAERATEAFGKGFAYDNTYTKRMRKDQPAVAPAGESADQYADSPWTAGAFGAARGATLGLSDMVLTRMGLMDEEALRKLEEENPGASITGEIAGTMLPLLIPEPSSTAGATARGVGLAAKAARLATAPARVAIKGSLAAERAVAAVGAGIRNPVTRYTVEKIAARAAGGVAAGAMYGAGQAISDVALEDPKTLAEMSASEIGLDMLMQTGESAITGGILAPVAGVGMDAAGAVLSPGFRWIGKKVASAVDRENLRGIAADQAVKSLGPTAHDVRRVMKRVASMKQTENGLERIGGVRNMGDDLLNEGIVTARDTLDSSATKLASRVQELGQEVGSIYESLDAAAAGRLPKASSFRSFIRKTVLDPIKDEPTLATYYKGIEDDLGARMEVNGLGDLSFSKVWDWRQRIDDTINWKAPELTLRNRIWSNYRDAMKEWISTEGEKAYAAVGQPGFADRFKETNRLYSSLKMAKEITDSAQSRDMRNRFFSLTDHLGGVMTGAASGSFLLGLTAGAVNKFVVRERGTQIIASAARKLSDVRMLGAVHRVVSRRMDDAVEGLLSGRLPPDAKPALLGSTLAILNAQEPDMEAPRVVFNHGAASDPKVEAFHKISARVTDLATRPDMMRSQIEKMLGASDTLGENAPNYSAELANMMATTVGFIRDRTPKPQRQRTPFERPWAPTPQQLDSFARMMGAINDPVGVLHDATTGSPSKEGVEVLRTLYPKLLENVQTRYMEQLVETGKVPTFRVRMNLSRLLGQPLDPMATPEMQQYLREMNQKERKRAEEGKPRQGPSNGQPDLTRSQESRKSQNISEAMGERIGERTETEIGRLAK